MTNDNGSKAHLTVFHNKPGRLIEAVSCWAYDDGTIYVSHEVSDWAGLEAKGQIRLTRKMAEFVRDRLNSLIPVDMDPEYESWLASRQEPASARDNDGRFAEQGDEPPPAADDTTVATDAEYAERQIERGAP